ncbi:hypothetical protein [Hyalangium sp.]|uniref:hypothetical protein n=1 Tax=Hyalangium sp. TaxID=2028555 RepID=UPI002D55B04F|nr:hypothetical protein [Hyalangium sp.]HYH94768.1 hypothetical protein [Hyalangium sp.]
MTKNIVSVTVAVLSAGALLTGCNFDQPNAGCIVQDASFANWYAKYDLKPDQNLSAECQAKVVKGEVWGVFKFTDPQKADSSVLTIRPAGLYTRATRDPGDPYLQTAEGKLAEEPDASDFCAANEFSLATVNAGPSSTEPATSISYQFSNVKVYAAPDAPGTQIGADLAYTRDGCTIQLGVRALWPALACDPDSSNPAENCGAGSGMNPEFDVTCDPDLNRCVPTKAIPSLK